MYESLKTNKIKKYSLRKKKLYYYHLWPQPIVHIGLCLPESCENTIIQSTVQSYLKTLPLPMMDLYDLNMTVIGSKATDYDMVFITSTAFVLLGYFLNIYLLRYSRN